MARPEVLVASAPYSSLMPAAAKMSALTLISLRTKASNSASVIGRGSAASAAIFLFTSSVPSALTISALSRSTTSRGVRAGAKAPTQKMYSAAASPGSGHLQGEELEHRPGDEATGTARALGLDVPPPPAGTCRRADRMRRRDLVAPLAPPAAEAQQFRSLSINDASTVGSSDPCVCIVRSEQYQIGATRRRPELILNQSKTIGDFL